MGLFCVFISLVRNPSEYYRLEYDSSTARGCHVREDFESYVMNGYFGPAKRGNGFVSTKSGVFYVPFAER
jgi:hypothetical protein